jgi:regulation of enolase protein 1 (concanavalin A-like superfamily)
VADPDWDWVKIEWGDADTGEFFTDIPAFWTTFDRTTTLVVRVTDVRGGVATDTKRVSIAESDSPTVEVQRPGDETIAAGEPFTIRWSAFDDNGIGEFDVFARTNGGPWTAVAECTNVPGDLRSCVWRNPGPVTAIAQVLVIVTDVDGFTAEDESASFRIENPTGPGPLPVGWFCDSIGAVAATGSCSFAGGAFTIQGSGADIWGAADEFQMAGRLLSGDFTLTARVASVENVNRWTKVGLMIRDWNGGNPGARHASFFVTPTTEKGTAFQRRPTQGGTSISSAGPVTTAPLWVKLSRTGNVIRAFYRKNSTDGWTAAGTQTFSNLPGQLTAMLVVSSHVDGTLATGRFDNVVVDETESMQSANIGATAAGTTATDSATFTIEGNGADIWGNADAFRFHYARWRGDGSITVRVRSVENTHAWAKAGVMFRETTEPASKHVMAIVSPGKGIAMQYRANSFDVSANAALAAGTAPRWLRLTRVGNTFTSASSVDGTTWTTLGSTTVSMIADILVGLAVTSHSNGTLATAVFDDVLIQP